MIAKVILLVTAELSRADVCSFEDAVNLASSPTTGDSLFMPFPALRACIEATSMTNYQALWTLHNLRYGVAETYSFTDLVTDVSTSVHMNECNHRTHEVNVDITEGILGQIRVMNETMTPMTKEQQDQFLAEERPAYPFHANLMRLFGQLHDAHTFYSSPYEMFRVYFPINFGSKMVGNKQVVTLRYSTNPTDPIGRIAYVYQRVYGAPPLSARLAGSVITHINGKEAMEFLFDLVDGPLAGNYQQREQRLNGFIFNAELLVLAQLVSPLPDFEELHLRFENGATATVKLIGQLSSLETAFHEFPSIRSVAGLSQYLHSNKQFDSFLSFEDDLDAKQLTLTLLGDGIKPRIKEVKELWDQISRKHRALVDTLANLERDSLLNLPVLVPDQGVVSDDDDIHATAAISSFSPAVLASADDLDDAIKKALEMPSVFRRMFGMEDHPKLGWTNVHGMSYAFHGDTVIVRIPSMKPAPRFKDDSEHYFFPDFVGIQKAAKERGITRLLFDVSKNGGGFVMSAYALQWYTMTDLSEVCVSYRMRMTDNWNNWLESFGQGLASIVAEHLEPLGDDLADHVDRIFDEITALVNVLYDGLGFSSDDFKQLSKTQALTRVNTEKARVKRMQRKSEKANALRYYIKNRIFVPPQFKRKDTLLPPNGFCPFDFEEMVRPESGGTKFEAGMHPFAAPEEKRWGSGKPSNYSQPGEYAFCHKVLAEMPKIVPEYERGYWTQIAFVSDGTCGSACALFTQGIQTNGDAVAFTYGGLADTALDVAAFAGGNLEEYDEFWPGIAFGARVGRLASLGKAKFTKAHENSWVSHPIAFPSKAKARFNWNMMFVRAMGPHALPRQFYIIPGRKHFNLWGGDEKSLEELYADIIGIPDWAAITPQFAVSHGICPKETAPFSRKIGTY